MFPKTTPQPLRGGSMILMPSDMPSGKLLGKRCFQFQDPGLPSRASKSSRVATAFLRSWNTLPGEMGHCLLTTRHGPQFSLADRQAKQKQLSTRRLEARVYARLPTWLITTTPVMALLRHGHCESMLLYPYLPSSATPSWLA